MASSHILLVLLVSASFSTICEGLIVARKVGIVGWLRSDDVLDARRLAWGYRPKKDKQIRFIDSL